jgi:hypothetical protein
MDRSGGGAVELLLVSRALCRIEEIELNLAGDDPYGEVLSGNLRLRVRPLIVIKG